MDYSYTPGTQLIHEHSKEVWVYDSTERNGMGLQGYWLHRLADGYKLIVPHCNMARYKVFKETGQEGLGL